MGVPESDSCKGETVYAGNSLQALFRTKPKFAPMINENLNCYAADLFKK